MLAIGLIVGIVALVVFFVLIAEYDESISGILISFFFVVMGVAMIVYDVRSPVEVYISDTFITTKYKNTSYSQPVKITTYNREATKLWAITKDTYNFKYEVEILSKEAIKFWENN